jgi:hypothetical protein
MCFSCLIFNILSTDLPTEPNQQISSVPASATSARGFRFSDTTGVLPFGFSSVGGSVDDKANFACAVDHMVVGDRYRNLVIIILRNRELIEEAATKLKLASRGI